MSCGHDVSSASVPGLVLRLALRCRVTSTCGEVAPASAATLSSWPPIGRRMPSISADPPLSQTAISGPGRPSGDNGTPSTSTLPPESPRNPRPRQQPVSTHYLPTASPSICTPFMTLSAATSPSMSVRWHGARSLASPITFADNIIPARESTCRG